MDMSMAEALELVAQDVAAACGEHVANVLSAVVESQTAENERLRGLLAIARDGLRVGLNCLREYAGPYANGVPQLSRALTGSNPDQREG